MVRKKASEIWNIEEIWRGTRFKREAIVRRLKRVPQEIGFSLFFI